MNRLRKKKTVIRSLAVVLVIALIICGCAVYVSDYYRADIPAIEAFCADGSITETMIGDGIEAYGDPNAEYGWIFYPGGKVEYTAYIPLMRQIAFRGVLCVLIEMPFNLAVLDMNAADGICAMFPEVAHWYIGGHSLGGTMAAYYADAHPDTFEGLVLLGSYSSADLSDADIRVLSVFGSEDNVMNRKKYVKYKKNLPKELTEIEIAGGCHAYFGMYGMQNGDGIPSITAEEQIRTASGCIAEFMTEGEK